MNRNDGGIFFLAVSCLAGKPLVRQRALSCTGRGFKSFWYARQLFYVQGACLPAIFELCLEGIFPEIRPLRIVLISFGVSPFRTFRINLLYEQDAVLSV